MAKVNKRGVHLLMLLSARKGYQIVKQAPSRSKASSNSPKSCHRKVESCLHTKLSSSQATIFQTSKCLARYRSLVTPVTPCALFTEKPMLKRQVSLLDAPGRCPVDTSASCRRSCSPGVLGSWWGTKVMHKENKLKRLVLV